MSRESWYPRLGNVELWNKEFVLCKEKYPKFFDLFSYEKSSENDEILDREYDQYCYDNYVFEERNLLYSVVHAFYGHPGILIRLLQTS